MNITSSPSGIQKLYQNFLSTFRRNLRYKLRHFCFEEILNRDELYYLLFGEFRDGNTSLNYTRIDIELLSEEVIYAGACIFRRERRDVSPIDWMSYNDEKMNREVCVLFIFPLSKTEISNFNWQQPTLKNFVTWAESKACLLHNPVYLTDISSNRQLTIATMALLFISVSNWIRLKSFENSEARRYFRSSAWTLSIPVAFRHLKDCVYIVGVCFVWEKLQLTHCSNTLVICVVGGYTVWCDRHKLESITRIKLSWTPLVKSGTLE